MHSSKKLSENAMLVADTNAIAYLYIPGEHHAAAVRAYRRDPDWLTVAFWRYEFVNVLWKTRRAGRYDAEAAARTFELAVARMAPRVRASDDMEALNFALGHRISAYDAYFVTLAKKLKLPLLTQDKELLAKFPEQAVSLEAFAEGSKN